MKYDELAVYSLYGKQSVTTGSDVTPFGFQGSYTDSTGLIYLINRYYDPASDQFLSVDPDVATTDQPYVFTNDEPLNSSDPLGTVPSVGSMESDSTVEDVGATYTGLQAQAAVNRAVLDYIKIEREIGAENVKINQLWQEETLANLEGLSDALTLTRAYNAAVTSFQTLLNPKVTAMIQLAYDGYSLYQAAIPVARSGALGVRLQALANSADEVLSDDVTSLATATEVAQAEVAEDLAFDFGVADAGVDTLGLIGEFFTGLS